MNATQTSKEGLGPSLKREFLWWKPRMYGSHHHRHMTTKSTWHRLNYCRASDVSVQGKKKHTNRLEKKHWFPIYIHTHHAILIFSMIDEIHHKNPMALGGGFIKTSTPPKLQGKSHTKDHENLKCAWQPTHKGMHLNRKIRFSQPIISSVGDE